MRPASTTASGTGWSAAPAGATCGCVCVWPVPAPPPRGWTRWWWSSPGSACVATCLACTAPSPPAPTSPTACWRSSTAACATWNNASTTCRPCSTRRPPTTWTGWRRGSGIVPDHRFAEQLRRDIVSNARHLLDLRGTATGLRELLVVALGFDRVAGAGALRGHRLRLLPTAAGDLPAAARRTHAVAAAAVGARALPVASLVRGRRQHAGRQHRAVGRVDRQAQPARPVRTRRGDRSEGDPGPAARPVPRATPTSSRSSPRSRREPPRPAGGPWSSWSPGAARRTPSATWSTSHRGCGSGCSPRSGSTASWPGCPSG